LSPARVFCSDQAEDLASTTKDRREVEIAMIPPGMRGEEMMGDAEGVRAMTCPACGAQVHATEGQYRTTCQYCGALLELPRPSQPNAIPTIIATPAHARPESTVAHPKGCTLFAIVLTLIMLGAIGLVIFGVYRGLSGTNLSSIRFGMTSWRVSMPALIVLGADNGDPDALVYTDDYSSDTSFLSYFDGHTRTLRWQTAPLGEDSYLAAMVENDTMILVVVKTRVMALDRETGQITWEASVSDDLPSSCAHDCLRLVGQRVVILARDGGLYGLDAQSGRMVWNTRLNSTPDRLYAVDDQVAVLDNRDGSVVLLIIDPIDGSERQTLRPKCSDSSSGSTDDPDLNSSILVSPDQKSLVILFGFFNSCVQRWAVASGTMTWNAFLGDIRFSHGFGPSPILLGDSIYVASEHQIVEVKLADGKWRILISDPDYEFVPLMEGDGILITRAKRTRGTTRFELWGLDAATGKQVWQHPFPGSEPLDEPDRMGGLIDQGDSAWTAHLTSAGLVVVQAMAQPHQLTVETLDPRTGASGGPVAIPLTGVIGDFYTVPEVVGWPHDQLWLMVDGRMYVVNLAHGRLEFMWP
jgi:outer membrane protein assembly factor BamB